MIKNSWYKLKLKRHPDEQVYILIRYVFEGHAYYCNPEEYLDEEGMGNERKREAITF